MCIECRYRDKCTSYPDKCGSCANNEGKRDYYVPRPYPNPWWWPYTWPYTNPPYIWYTTSVTQCSGKSDYYTTSNAQDVPVTC
jgi:hypothetical protein